MKKLLSILLTICLMLTVLPFGVFNLTASAVTSGTTGECTWSLNGTVLTIGGHGGMGNFLFDSPPWGKEITKVIVEEGVTSIGWNAFCYCQELNTVILSDSVTSIGENAFSGCSKLTNLALPSNLKGIFSSGFAGCSSLSNITIPKSVEAIYSGAFSGCNNLNTIVVDADNAFFHSKDNCLIKTENSKLLLGCKNSIIPNYVTSIDSGAFNQCKGLTSINIPDSVTSIGSGAFYECENLEFITISDNVKEIGPLAFYNTYFYNNIDNWEDGYLYINKHLIKAAATSECEIKCDTLTIAGSAFMGNIDMTSINLPDSLISIGEGAFASCFSLQSINIPNNILHIGKDAFENCTSLQTVSIDNLLGWCNIAFENRTANPTYYSKKLYLNGEIITNLIIPDGVTNINDYSFKNIELESVLIPHTVNAIGIEAFSNCTKLNKVYLGRNVKDIGLWAFDGCLDLSKVYYEKDESAKSNIDFNLSNEILVNTTWTYNYCMKSDDGDHAFSSDCDEICDFCGTDRKSVINHSFEWIIDKENNCGVDGSKYEECSICHTKRNENTVINATNNHNYEWVIDRENNCGVDGFKHEECSVCHTKRNEDTVINATGNHSYEWIVDEENSCGVDGFKHEECSVCHIKLNENTVINATGNHSFEWVIDKENNCVKDGVKHEECSVCHTKRNENTVLPATGHIYDNGSDSSCNVCGHERQYYTLTYNGNGENGAPNKQTLYEGTAITLPTIVSDYYRFLGWSKTPNGGVDYRIGNSYTVTENVTLYAKWARHCYYCDDIGFKNITENRKVDCWTCHGTGQIERKDTTNRRCLDCGSTSYTYHSVPGNNGMYGWYYECNLCGSKDVSTGYVEKVSCTHCSGIGYKYETYSTTQVCTECNGLGFHKISQVNAPQPQLASKTSTSVTLVQFDGVDYSMDGETWQESNVFKNLIPEKEYCFFMRYKANGIHTVGSYGARLYVTTNSLFPSTITSSKYTISGKNISKITAGTTVSSLLAGLNEGSYCKVYKGNSVVSGNTAVGTGMVVKIMDGNTVKASYTVIVTGDTNGDGAISVTDMIAIKAHILNKSTLTGVYATAANTNGDSGISITDFIQVKAKILGKGSITAR